MKKQPSKGWLEFRQNAPTKAREGLRRALRWCGASFGVEPRKALEALKNGLVFQNPVLLLLLGLCSALAVTTSLKQSLAMGLATTAVVALSNLVLALLRRRLPHKARAAVYVAVAAVPVAALGLLCGALRPDLSEGLGLALPLIVVNGMLLARTDALSADHTPGWAAVNGLGMGLGLTLALCLLGTVRELLGAGTLWGVPLLGRAFQPVLLLAAPWGGLVLLGLFLALARWLRNGNGERGGRKG